MATHPKTQDDDSDCDSDMDFTCLTGYTVPHCTTAGLEEQVQNLQSEVEKLRECLHDSLELQRSILKRWEQSDEKHSDSPGAQQPNPTPMATSTPFIPAVTKSDPTSCSGAHVGHSDSFLQPHSLEQSNTSRVIAAALHHTKLEPPVFAGDSKVPPEDWLQAVNTYKSSLNLTDIQILHELPRFLAKEPGKWFKALSSHVSTWAQFCQLFETVFLPSDLQERVLRGILDRVQAPHEPLPTFVAHMLGEFNKLKSPPPAQEQIELICKHSLEKYRVALYGAPIFSVMDLLLRAHELHAVLGPSGHQSPPAHLSRSQNIEPHCFRCSRPGFTSRTCPTCNTASQAPSPPKSQPMPTPSSLATVFPDVGEPRVETDSMSFDTPLHTRQSGNFRGGRTFHRGNPPSRR